MEISRQAEALLNYLKKTDSRTKLTTALVNPPLSSESGKYFDYHNFENTSKINKSQFQGHDIYRVIPANSNGQKLLMFHGGGFVYPMTKSFTIVANQFVKAGFEVILPDYPLLTSATSYEIIQWCREFYRDIYSSDIILFGDSAGANIALKILSTEPYLLPRKSILFSLVPDLSLSSESCIAASSSDLALDRSLLMESQKKFFDDVAFENFDHFPEKVSIGNVRFEIGGNDMSSQDTIELALKLSEYAPNNIAFYEHPMLPHDFIMWSSLPESKQTIQNIIKWLK